MASPKRRYPDNAPGDFFVDRSCIDCGTCRWVAPASFSEAADHSFVAHQPRTDAEHVRALMALIACPTGSIGTLAKDDLARARAAFPERIDGDVYHCGWHSRDSFGAASYLIRRPAGNVLVDSPRYSSDLVRQLEELGGVALMFLTHRDDVADHRRLHAHFGCARVLHADDVTADTRDVEHKLAGRDPIALADDLVVLPVPGHTRGSACLLYRDTYLFSGDHVAWSPTLAHIYAFRDACWYDWDALKESMRRLAEHRFEWILPGHGRRCHFPAARMKREMRRCLEWLARH
jgi:glyoxylase-like metal-dependent hydrolase (beta-lactamase superfamily II)